MFQRWMILAFGCLLMLSRPGAGQLEKRISIDFKNADLCYVLKVLAKEIECNLFLGPTLRGSVTLKLDYVSAEFALSEILRQQPSRYAFKLLRGPVTPTLIVGAPENLEEIENDHI